MHITPAHSSQADAQPNSPHTHPLQPNALQAIGSGEGQHQPSPVRAPFRDRRQGASGRQGSERRQFASTHDGLSPEARELALAIDGYKMQHRRRYITFEEMLHVIHSLGYERAASGASSDEAQPQEAQPSATPSPLPSPVQQLGIQPLTSSLSEPGAASA